MFDPRYLLLTSKERKQVFDKYVRERADEERREKKSKMKVKREAFKQLMEETGVHGKSSFSEFHSKHGKDERFKVSEVFSVKLPGVSSGHTILSLWVTHLYSRRFPQFCLW